MARLLYAATPADYVIDGTTGLPKPNVTVTIYDAITGGTQVTDLQNSAQQAATTLTTASDGTFRFYGPDGTSSTLYAAVTGVSARYAVFPVDVPDRPRPPAGGTTSQVLKKNSNTDYDFGWVNQSSTALTPPATLTITNAADTGLKIVGAASQSANLFEVQSSAAATFFAALPGGRVQVGSGGPSTGTVRIATASTTDRGVVIKQKSSQTAKPLEITDSNDAVVMSVGTDGTIAAPNIGAKLIVLDANASVPAGTPSGTVILRRP